MGVGVANLAASIGSHMDQLAGTFFTGTSAGSALAAVYGGVRMAMHQAGITDNPAAAGTVHPHRTRGSGCGPAV